jgi:glycosyltransferase involved in cell wall biosynthesis
MFPRATSEETIDGVKIVRRGNVFTVFFWASLYYFKNRQNINIIVDEVHGIPFFTILYARCPIVLFIHEVAGDIWRIMYRWPVSSIGQLLEQVYLRLYRNRLMWTDANSTVDELVRLGVPRASCVAIACPIGTRSQAHAPVKETKPTFIFVGRLVRMKRIDHILAAFRYIRKKFPNAHLRIVGEGNRGNAPGVTWYGRVSESRKLALLSSSHILLHTSIKEGWGLVVLEAASQWTPSVVYNVPGLVDTVRNGKTGVVVSQNSPENLAKEAISLCSDGYRYRAMQREAANFNNSFRWERATAQSRALLLRAL